jgi:GNAT superfamily N-acetyltransferase
VAQHYRESIRLFPIHTLTLATQYRPDFANLTEKLLGSRGKLDSWYLNLLAVDPDHRRRGVARALIDTIREKASILFRREKSFLN